MGIEGLYAKRNGKSTVRVQEKQYVECGRNCAMKWWEEQVERRQRRSTKKKVRKEVEMRGRREKKGAKKCRDEENAVYHAE